jgi:hypothetical protein
MGQFTQMDDPQFDPWSGVSQFRFSQPELKEFLATGLGVSSPFSSCLIEGEYNDDTTT